MRKGKKATGGKYNQSRKKKFHEFVGQRILVKMGEEKRKVRRVKGGNRKSTLFNVKFVNVIGNGKEKGKKIEIKNVLETPSNRFLARQQVITKGSIVETEIGKIRITNRPSQEGIANGVIVSN